MASRLTFSDLLGACTQGGPSVMTSVTKLSAAAGTHASITPAKFVEGSSSTFSYERRYLDGEPVETVMIDSVPSSVNRGESAIMRDIEAGDELLSRIPRIELCYGSRVFTDMDLSHRYTDGHIRAGKYEGKPVTEAQWYKDLRDGSNRNYKALLNTAPIALVCGVWDSTPRSNQVRIRRAVTGETIGVLADQTRPGADQQGPRSGARVDPVGASVMLNPEDFEKIVENQKDALSAKKIEEFHDAIKKLKKGQKISGSKIGVGALPPTLDPLGGVSCSRVIRSWVLSFTALRQLNFGETSEENIAGRALVAALAIALVARAEQELYYRSNCDLVEVAAPEVKLDLRYGNFKDLEPLSVESADMLLEKAINHAEKLGVADWQGQVKKAEGNPAIYNNAVADSEDSEGN
ncbi:type I-U CRISPR-associated protein Cas7 [Corynebacterium pyruviciproducens]|uniref:type I-G CRISPR-associated protein Cas7 n=1 Tax=Corynebacterium pyruviciproducens TaxID=598660 RepID=UPI0023F3E648|nr:type I-U CRISPR-associated protein Cas7 [Corynebacterium pyruviciproducens]